MTGTLVLWNVIAWNVQAALLVAVAFVLFRLLRIDAPAVRYGMMRILLAACLTLPVLQTPAPESARRGRVAASTTLTASAPGQLDPGAAPVSWRQRASDVVLPLVALGVSLRLSWLGLGLFRLRRLRRTGLQPDPGCVEEELQEALGCRADIRHVANLRQPVNFGFRRPVILLPGSWSAQPVAIQRAVLAHELWHVRRRDWAWTLGEEVVCALFWFVAPVWLLVSRIQSAREEVVDALAIRATGSRRSYAEALLTFADGEPLLATAGFVRRCHLVHRMLLISKEAVMSARHIVGAGAVMAAVVFSTGWYAVGAFPLVQEGADLARDLERVGPLEQRAKGVTPENPIPRRIHAVAVELPAGAEEATRGSITVRLTLDQSGRVAEARPLGLPASMRTRGTLMMSQAVVAAVKQWQYEPPFEAPLAFVLEVPLGSRGPGPASAQRTTSAWAGAENAIRVAGNINQPTKIVHASPVYPPIAQAAKVQGVVILEVRIEPDGTVGDARVLRSIPLLDQAALDAVQQWRYTPPLINGAPAALLVTTTVNFTLQ